MNVRDVTLCGVAGLAGLTAYTIKSWVSPSNSSLEPVAWALGAGLLPLLPKVFDISGKIAHLAADAFRDLTNRGEKIIGSVFKSTRSGLYIGCLKISRVEEMLESFALQAVVTGASTVIFVTTYKMSSSETSDSYALVANRIVMWSSGFIALVGLGTTALLTTKNFHKKVSLEIQIRDKEFPLHVRIVKSALLMFKARILSSKVDIEKTTIELITVTKTREHVESQADEIGKAQARTYLHDAQREAEDSERKANQARTGNIHSQLELMNARKNLEESKRKLEDKKSYKGFWASLFKS